MKRAYIDTPAGQVHYRMQGAGESLLLLHQAKTSSDEYVLMIPILAKNHQVIAMDTLGYGNSDAPAKAHPSVEDYAQNVVDFLNALGISRVSIFGHLTGAGIAVEVAAANPEMVNKLILSSCPFYTPDERKARLEDPKFSPLEIKKDGSHLMKLWSRYPALAPLASVELWQRSLVNYFLAGTRAEDVHQALFRYEMEKRLPLIKSPTLLIYGAKAPMSNKLEVTEKAIPSCKGTKFIEDVDAFIFYEKPEEMAKITLDFLQD